MRKLFVLFIGITLVSTVGYSQSICNCFTFTDTAFHIVPMTEGTDTGVAPYYRCGDCSSNAIILPFNFCFYGKNYDTVYIDNKGCLTLNKPVFNFSSDGFPAGNDTLMLAAFWADVNNLQANFSEIYYKITPTHLVVQWNNVGYQTFDNDLWNSFQITITNGADSILPPGNNVSYCYYTMEWESADSSGGIGGFGGVPAIFGVNKGDGVHYAQFGLFSQRSYYYYGPYDSNSGLFWIDNKSFIFSTCVNGNNIPPVILQRDTCYQDTICTGDTFKFFNTFLCAEKGQKAILTASSPGLSGLTSDTASVYSIYRISNHLVAQLIDTGPHVITVTATDNGSPPLTNNVQVKVFIKKCDTALAIDKLATANTQLTIYPNPNNGKFIVESAESKGENENSQVEIYNTLGQQIYSQLSTFPKGIHSDNSPLSIDLSSQPGGVYFCRLITNNGNLIGEGKFVIQ